jgi:tRNA pseudouridine38-40 synthase
MSPAGDSDASLPRPRPFIGQYAHRPQFVPARSFSASRFRYPGSLTAISCRKLSISHSLSQFSPPSLSGNLLTNPIPVTDSHQPDPDQRTFKLTLAYDGTDFHGWQVQPSLPTIQGELQAALGRITGEIPLPQGSGRTDAGVHALAQVASFPLQANIPPQNLMRALNGTLPPSIRVLGSITVPNTFHARHSAVAKTYEYRVFRQAVCPPFLVRYVLSCPWLLDIEAMQRSARLFEGRHDFLSFAATDPDLASRNSEPDWNPRQELRAPKPPPQTPEPQPMEPQTVRTVFSSIWEERHGEAGDLLVYRIRGTGFLHHMVRNLVGTMLEVGRGNLNSEDIPRILAARSRSAAGPTAPARGLFLHSVEYDPLESS